MKLLRRPTHTYVYYAVDAKPAEMSSQDTLGDALLLVDQSRFNLHFPGGECVCVCVGGGGGVGGQSAGYVLHNDTVRNIINPHIDLRGREGGGVGCSQGTWSDTILIPYC